jgi:hypothetical protein
MFIPLLHICLCSYVTFQISKLRYLMESKFLIGFELDFKDQGLKLSLEHGTNQ